MLPQATFLSKARPSVKPAVWRWLPAALGYFALARGGLYLASLQGNVSPVWPATGFAMWLIVWGGYACWPAIALGALAVNALTDVPFGVAVVMAAGNTGEALAGAWLIQLIARQREVLSGLSEVLGLLAGAIVGSAISATCGVGGLWLSSTIPDALVAKLWQTWWLGDALGALTVVPLLGSWVTSEGAKPRWWERALIGSLGVAVLGWVFFVPMGKTWVFLVYPLVLFAGWRGCALCVRGLVLMVAAVAVGAVIAGSGPFVVGQLNDDLVRMQIFLGSVAVTGLLIPIFKRHGSGLSLLVLLGGWALSSWVYQSQQAILESDKQERLRNVTADASLQITRRMAAYEDALWGGAGLYAASPEVSRARWRAFATALRLPERYPGINGIGVIYPVSPVELDSFVALQRADGLHGFAPKNVPEAERPAGPTLGNKRYLITYIEPMANNLAAVGLDISSEVNRRAAAERSRDTGTPQMTKRIILVQDGKKRPGFLLYLPIYMHGMEPGDLSTRRSSLVGWIYAPFVTENFLHSAIGGWSREVALSCYEGRSTAAADLLYESDPGYTRQPLELTTEITLAGQVFTLGWRRLPGFVSPDANGPVYITSAMALITVLLAGLVLTLQNQRHRAETLAEERTVELAEVNRLQRAMLDGTVFAVISCDTEGLIVNFNAGAEKMLGYTREEMIGKSPAIFHDPAEVEARALELSAELGRPVNLGVEAYAAKAQLGEVEERRWTYVRKDGSRLSVWLSLTALHDEQGKITGYLGIASDITQRERAEQQLRESRERLATIFSAADEGLTLQADNGKVLECNDAACRILGLTRDQLTGRDSMDVRWGAIREDGIPFPGDEHPAPLALRTRQAQRDVVQGLRRPDGTLAWIRVSSVPIIGADGSAQLVVSCFMDITQRLLLERELRSSEERWSFALEGSNSGVWDWDAETNKVFFSRQWKTMLGHAEHEVGNTLAEWESRVHPDDLAGAYAALQKHFSGEEPHYEHEHRIRHKNGHWVWVLDRGKVVEWAGPQKPRRVIGTHTDISAIKALQQNLEQARDEAVQASRLKSEFLASMSHEIRTPMNGIIGMADLLMETLKDREQQEMGRVIQHSAESLLTIINDLLDFSKIEAGKMSIEPEEFSFARLINECVALLAPKADAQGIGLRSFVDPRVPAKLMGDAGRLRQVVLNLLGNAIKFTPRGEVVIELRAESSAPGQATVRVEVRDTGIGISAETQGRLFQPFVQADGSTTKRFGGTGLGLAISRQLIELMGGSIHLVSEPGRGSTFWFNLDLPVVAVAKDNSAATSSPAESPSLSSPVSTAWRILLVDDNTTNRMVASMMLKKAGHRVEVAVNGRDALEMIARDRAFDVVLMDCQMPEMDGYTATQRIREEETQRGLRRLPVVALTAYAMSSDRQKCLAVGMDDYVAKPLRLEELLQAFCRIGLAGDFPVPEPAAAQPEGRGVDREVAPAVLAEEHLAQLRELPSRRCATLLEELIDLFLAQTPSNLTELQALAEAADFHTLAIKVHGLAGGSSNLGATDMRRVALEMEQAARRNDLPAVVSLMRELDQEWRRVKVALDQVKSTLVAS